MTNEFIKIVGKNFNCNFGVEKVKKLMTILNSEFNKEKCNDVDLMELIAGLSFVILGDFDCALDEYSTLEEDREKTIENLDKLKNYLFGGYYDR